MVEVVEETAYYLNRDIPAVALMSRGVRFPSGRWFRVAGATALPVDVEQLLADLFPELKGTVVRFAHLESDSDVQRFEKSLP
jgi:hypothetical protein